MMKMMIIIISIILPGAMHGLVAKTAGFYLKDQGSNPSGGEIFGPYLKWKYKRLVATWPTCWPSVRIMWLDGTLLVLQQVIPVWQRGSTLTCHCNTVPDMN